MDYRQRNACRLLLLLSCFGAQVVYSQEEPAEPSASSAEALASNEMSSAPSSSAESQATENPVPDATASPPVSSAGMPDDNDTMPNESSESASVADAEVQPATATSTDTSIESDLATAGKTESPEVSETQPTTESTTEKPTTETPLAELAEVAETPPKRRPARSRKPRSPRGEGKAKLACADPETLQYQRTVLFTQMPLKKLMSANIGVLGNVNEAFAQTLSDRAAPEQRMNSHLDLSTVLPKQMRYAPGQIQTASVVQGLAERYDAQFVVGGEVSDMSMLDEKAYRSGSPTMGAVKKLYAAMKDKVVGAVKSKVMRQKGEAPKTEVVDQRTRLFNFNLSVYDGFTGEVVFAKDYSVSGVWDPKYTASIGYATPKFWKTPYGQSISTATSQAVAELGAVINCQPFVMPVEIDPVDKRIYMRAGMSSGVAVGDAFDIYMRSQVPVTFRMDYSQGLSTPPSYQTLRKQNSLVTIQAVYPNYSIAQLNKPLQMGRRYVALYQPPMEVLEEDEELASYE